MTVLRQKSILTVVYLEVFVDGRGSVWAALGGWLAFKRCVARRAKSGFSFSIGGGRFELVRVAGEIVLWPYADCLVSEELAEDH